MQERYDLANTDFDIANFDGWVPVDYTAAGPSPTPPTPWEPDSIVLVCSPFLTHYRVLAYKSNF